jgi:glycosyltransferase involved in cell wall biosynthesis
MSQKHHIPERPLVLVHGGARDGYHVARALLQAGLLEAFVTDYMWAEPQTRLGKAVVKILPARLRNLLRKRSHDTLAEASICNHYFAAARSILLDHVPQLPFSLRRAAIRSSDAALGKAAGQLANRRHAGLLSYSYYAYDAFTVYNGPGVLFQVHPHPISIRRILTAELKANPDCAGSLNQEWELALPEAEFARLSEEPRLARRFLCASSFTRQTLVENGADPAAIRVVPYGVDANDFRPATGQWSTGGKLKLLFVGRINQRKGIKYLLQALDMLRSDQIELTVCGRVIDGLDLFASFSDRVTIRPSVSSSELRAAYQAADLFVFPSVAEGFGQVLLESLSSGLPVLSTFHTAAPDLIRDCEAGFIVEPGRPDLLAAKIEWALTHRESLLAMRTVARQAAARFTWERFRGGIVSAVREFNTELAPELLRESANGGQLHG